MTKQTTIVVIGSLRVYILTRMKIAVFFGFFFFVVVFFCFFFFFCGGGGGCVGLREG